MRLRCCHLLSDLCRQWLRPPNDRRKQAVKVLCFCGWIKSNLQDKSCSLAWDTTTQHNQSIMSLTKIVFSKGIFKHIFYFYSSFLYYHPLQGQSGNRSTLFSFDKCYENLFCLTGTGLVLVLWFVIIGYLVFSRDPHKSNEKKMPSVKKGRLLLIFFNNHDRSCVRGK